MSRQPVMRFPVLARPDNDEITTKRSSHIARHPAQCRADLEAGDILASRYQLVECIAKGGMGDVHRARDLLLEREVAIKLMKPLCLGEPNAAARCEREAHAMAALDSPFLPPIYDLGYQGVHIFLVMRYIAAPPLSAIITQEGPLSSMRVARIACNVLDALAHMHSRQFIHRDVKPANVLVDRYDHATLVDLGIVLDTSASSLTSRGYALGTPAYMSPEQRYGRPLDERSDLYSVGITLMYALTGRLTRNSSPERNHAEQAGELMAPWDRIIGQAVHGDVEERFRSAEGMKRAIVRAMDEAEHGDRTGQSRLDSGGTGQPGGRWRVRALRAVPGMH